MNFIFPYIGNFIIPTDELIFFRGVGSTTNQFLLFCGDAVAAIDLRESHPRLPQQ